MGTGRKAFGEEQFSVQERGFPGNGAKRVALKPLVRAQQDLFININPDAMKKEFLRRLVLRPEP